jgi:hypothetical protein
MEKNSFRISVIQALGQHESGAPRELLGHHKPQAEPGQNRDRKGWNIARELEIGRETVGGWGKMMNTICFRGPWKSSGSSAQKL